METKNVLSIGCAFSPDLWQLSSRKNDVGSRLRKFFAKIAEFAKIAKIAKNAKNAKNAKSAKIAKIAETEMVRFLKTFKIWVFFEKNRCFLKKNSISFKIAKDGKFVVECISIVFVSWKCLPP